MLLRTHFAFGILLISFLFPYAISPWFFSCFLILGALLPDIDTKYSSFGRPFAFRPLQLILQHRGVTHSITFLIFCSLPVLLLFPNGFYGFLIGYGSHLFLDALTVKGIPLFWPLSLRIHGPLKTGGLFDALIFSACLIGSVVLAFLQLGFF